MLSSVFQNLVGRESLIAAEDTWALLAIMCLGVAFSIYLEQKYNWASKVSGAILALIIAMVLANLSIIPIHSVLYDDIVWGMIVPMGIPLLLLQCNLSRVWRDTGKMLIVFLIGAVGTVCGAIIAFFALRGPFGDASGLAKVASMMTGSYIGGGVNFAAMASQYAAGEDLTAAATVADNLLMAAYFFVLIAIPTIKFFLKKFKHPYIDEVEARKASGEGENQAASYWKAKPVALIDIAEALAIAFAIVAISTAIADFFAGLIPTSNFGLALLNGLLGNKYLIMPTLTMLLATIKPEFMGNIGGAQEIGTFLIHIFFAVIGVPASIYLIMTQAPLLLVFCAIIVGMNMIFSFVFGKIFKFNLEEICIASNANVGGPTTAAALAIAKGWQAMVVPALLVGTLGYVIGNYYGIFVGTFLGR